MSKSILIVGGGFGGVVAAVRLRKELPDAKIRLLSDKNYLQYYAALYRLVTGRSPMEVCLPLSKVLPKDIEVIIDRAQNIDLQTRSVLGASGSRYRADILIFAVGSHASYFGIPGIEEHSFSIRTVCDAIRLKAHLHEVFQSAVSSQAKDQSSKSRIVIVGGGATGVELAGELAGYARSLAIKHGVPPSFVSIDLIEAQDRLLANLSEEVSTSVLSRLRSLGVNVYLHRSVEKESIDELILSDMSIKTSTVVWTAGLQGNALFASSDVPKDKRGRILVDNSLQVQGLQDIYVIGDAAATKWSGMAQTAVDDAACVARTIGAKLKKTPLPTYEQKEPVFAIPVGPHWCVVSWKGRAVYGYLGWILRRLADLHVFMLLLPLRDAIRSFLSGGEHCETCEVCKRVTVPGSSVDTKHSTSL